MRRTQPPIASFTRPRRALGRGRAARSSDPDGTIASYAWDFGDGATGTGATPSHTYRRRHVQRDADGDRQPRRPDDLDPDGDGRGRTRLRSASFTATPTNLGRVRRRRPRTLTARSPPTPGTSATEHRHRRDPDAHLHRRWTYKVALTVTDNHGATNTVNQTVAVTVPASGVGRERRVRSHVANGVGDRRHRRRLVADRYRQRVRGRQWGGLDESGHGRCGVHRDVGFGVGARFNAAIDTSISAAATGNGMYMTLIGRQVGKYNYQLKERIMPGGAVHLVLSQVVNGSETIFKETNVSGLTYNAGDVTRVRFQITTSGASTSITARCGRSGRLNRPRRRSPRPTVTRTCRRPATSRCRPSCLRFNHQCSDGRGYLRQPVDHLRKTSRTPRRPPRSPRPRTGGVGEGFGCDRVDR